MSERKVLNKYYPPDFDPSKIPRMKLPKNRQYTVRLMAPFNMRCATCGEYIYKGKKFNARKEDVENQDYLGIRIYRFYIKCTRCLQEISFKTDPRNTDYEIEAGATRNFMALKLAEELAQREEEEAKEEEANNPMKLLENRTKQSKNEIELLESLEELKDLNKRQQAVDYDTMLSAYNNKMTEREREEKLKQMDEDFIKTIKFQSNQKRKVVLEEEIIELPDEPQVKTSKLETEKLEISKEKKVPDKSQTWNQRLGVLTKKKPLAGLVKIKPKSDTITPTNTCNASCTQGENNAGVAIITESSGSTNVNVSNNKESSDKVPKVNGLSLLGSYSDSDDSE